MRAKFILLPLVMLALAALACGGGGGGSNVLYRDDFSSSSSGWGTGEDSTASLQYSGGEYVFEIYESDWFIWGNPGEDDLSNIQITVTAANVGAAADPTFGIICNYQSDDAFYYMGIGADGYYAIVRVEGEDDIFLTNEDNLWIHSEDIEINADNYELTAVCAEDGTLSLTVNGVEIASVNDTTYTEGDIGLFALSFEETPVEVHFDNLVVTRPGQSAND